MNGRGKLLVDTYGKIKVKNSKHYNINPQKTKLVLVRIAISLLLSFIITEQVEAQLTGVVRKDFIEGFERSCFKTQRAGTPNQQLSDTALKQYCKCASTYLADMLNDALIKDIEAGKVKFNSGWYEISRKNGSSVNKL